LSTRNMPLNSFSFPSRNFFQPFLAVFALLWSAVPSSPLPSFSLPASYADQGSQDKTLLRSSFLTVQEDMPPIPVSSMFFRTQVSLPFLAFFSYGNLDSCFVSGTRDIYWSLLPWLPLLPRFFPPLSPPFYCRNFSTLPSVASHLYSRASTHSHTDPPPSKLSSFLVPLPISSASTYDPRAVPPPNAPLRFIAPLHSSPYFSLVISLLPSSCFQCPAVPRLSPVLSSAFFPFLHACSLSPPALPPLFQLLPAPPLPFPYGSRVVTSFSLSVVPTHRHGLLSIYCCRLPPFLPT